jgi:hypothetical protein
MRSGIARDAGAAAYGREFKHFLGANKDVIVILFLAAGVRAVVCILSNNEWGDADFRASIAGEWASSPYLIRTGIWLPLHFYAAGLLTLVFGNPITAGKALSFATGTLTVIPLFSLVQRLFDRQTAVIAGLYFAFFGNHIGLSSVVMSEAPFVLFAVWGLNVFFREVYAEPPRWRGFLQAAVLIALAGGFRQEGWQLTGILAVYLLLYPRLRSYAIPFTLVGLSSYMLWTLAQVTADIDWLHPLTAVAGSKSQEALVVQFSALRNFLRWIWVFIQSPGPVVSLLSLAGLYIALRRHVRLDLAFVATLLLGPYIVLSLVKPQWAPQPRYAVIFTTLMIPYAAAATILVAERGHSLRMVVGVVLLATLASQAAAYHRHSRLFLPLWDYDVNDIGAWRWLSANAEPTSTVIVEDTGWRAPGLIVHGGLFAHENHIIYPYMKPEVLERYAAPGPHPILIVLHSPLSRWGDFFGSLNATTVYQNEDYRILRVAPKI